MASGQYRGSHAFTRTKHSYQESVNPNTGSLTIRAPLLDIPGVQPAVDFSLNLLYSSGSLGTFGLPRNWGLDLPYVCQGKSLTTKGRTYVVDLAWSDSEGHKSGLRYVNNHDIVLKKIIPPQPLPSGKKGLYGWKLQNSDGSCDYLDEAGKPRERHDLYGNHFHLTYVNDLAGGVDTPGLWLRSVEDSWGQQIAFGHQPGSSLVITSPDGGKTKITFSDAAGGVTSVTNAEGLKTTFEYTIFEKSHRVVSSVRYSNGLRSRYGYAGIPYIASDGTRHNMAAVQEHYQVHSSSGNTVRHVRYGYGSGSNATFTGAVLGLRMGGNGDPLMDSGPRTATYKYDVVKTVSDGDKKPMMRMRTWYNNLHLPMEEMVLAPDDEGGFTETRKTVYTYKIDYERFARTSAYELPVQTEVYNRSQGSAWVASRRTKATHNGFYRQITCSDEIWHAEKGYELQSTVEKEYYTTSLDTQIVKRTTQRDNVAHYEEVAENTLTPDEKNISSISKAFRSFSDGDTSLKPWKHISYSYSAQGRLTSESLAWSQGAAVPTDSATSTTTKTDYEYQNGILIESRTNALGETEKVERNMTKPQGPVTRRTWPMGQTESFTHDAMGRVTKQIDASGLQTDIKYETTESQGTLVTVTKPTGYVTTVRIDMLDREVEATDNAGPTESASTPRTLWTKTYDALSRVIEMRDRYSLVTSHTYDELNRPLSTTDPKGNVVRFQYEDGGSKVTQSLNGDRRLVRTVNARSEVIKEVTYADSGDKHVDHCLVEESAYDGRGNKTSSKLYKDTGNTGTAGSTDMISDTVMVYGPEKAVVSETVTGYMDKGPDVVRRRFEYDLFGNVYSYVKDVTYSDGRQFLGHQGGVHIFDNANRPFLFRDREGREERQVYDRNGWLSKLVRTDGSEIRYNHDSLGQILDTTYPDSQTTYTYDSGARLTSLSEGEGNSVQYTYSLDSVPLVVKIGDGRTQNYTLDQHGRVISEKDACGITQETTFDSVGEVSSQRFGGDTLEYSYGDVNHTKGLLLATTLSGGRTPLRTDFEYDGFGRVRRTVVRDPSSSKTLLDTDLTLDAQGRVMAMTSRSEVSADLNTQRAFTYDGLGQLVEEKIRDATTGTSWSVTAYSYDGNSNVISVRRNDHLTTMTYNKIDQRTDSGIEYDKNGRMVVDGQGNHYRFDDRDRLVSVERSQRAGKSSFAYHADNFLSQNHREGSTTGKADMYYTRGKINVIRDTEPEKEDGAGDTSFFYTPDSELVSSRSTTQGKEYYFKQLGSTALIMQDPAGGGDSPPRYVSASYDAYGNPLVRSDEKIRSEGSSKKSGPHFGFVQEFSDPDAGLVYFRSRYYNPLNLAFISMDSRRRQENRYTYCSGDPVNRSDPSGHDWRDEWFTTRRLTSMALGFVAGIAVSLVAGPAVGAAMASAVNLATAGTASGMAILAGAVATEVVAPIVAGAISGIAAGAVYSVSMEEKIDGWDIAVWATGGAVGEAVGMTVRPYVRPFMSKLMASGKKQNFLKWGTRRVLAASSNKATQFAMQLGESSALTGVAGAAGLTAASHAALSSAAPSASALSGGALTTWGDGAGAGQGANAAIDSDQGQPTAAVWCAEVWGSPGSLEWLG